MPRNLLITPRSELSMPEKIPRLYLDQMLRLDVAQVLRDEGYDVVRASEVGQARADDHEILQKAISDKRVLITLDEHFGDWTVLPLSSHPGVIRVKVNPTTSENIIKVLIPFIRLHHSQNFENNLVILSFKRSKWILTS
jgi:predicted nuclease of predicted toxin-antitoxin system